MDGPVQIIKMKCAKMIKIIQTIVRSYSLAAGIPLLNATSTIPTTF